MRLIFNNAEVHDLALRLAARERRTISDIVELALKLYEKQTTSHEPAELFYARMAARDDDEDLDIDALIGPHK